MVQKKCQGQQAAHQVENAYNHLGKYTGEIPASTKSFQFFSEVKNGPDRRRDKDGRISKPARSMAELDSLSGSLFRSLADLLYRIAPTCTDVVDMKSWQIHLLHSQYVRIGNVHHVSVIAHACSVGCWIITSVDFKIFPPAGSSLQQKGNNVRFRIVPLAPLPSASASIEISESNHAPTIREGVPPQNSLQNQLALTVGIYRLCCMVFVNRNSSGRPIDRCGGRKNKLTNTMRPKHLKHRYARSNVGVQKDARINHRLRYQGLCCEMKKNVKLLPGEQVCKRITITEVESVERYAIRNAIRMPG